MVSVSFPFGYPATALQTLACQVLCSLRRLKRQIRSLWYNKGMAYSNFQQNRIDAGLCKDCGMERTTNGTKINCRDCANAHSVSATKSKQKTRLNFKEGQCKSCGSNVSNSQFKTCETCRIYCRNYAQKTAGTVRKYKTENKVCFECSSKAYSFANRCCKHIMGNTIRKYGIPLTDWKIYWNKLEEQEFKCFYTGVDLIPEKNLSLDHLQPRSKGGTNNIDNCVWCDRNINAFKNDSTFEEFVSRCKMIAERF